MPEQFVTQVVATFFRTILYSNDAIQNSKAANCATTVILYEQKISDKSSSSSMCGKSSRIPMLLQSVKLFSSICGRKTVAKKAFGSTATEGTVDLLLASISADADGKKKDSCNRNFTTFCCQLHWRTLKGSFSWCALHLPIHFSPFSCRSLRVPHDLLKCWRHFSWQLCMCRTRLLAVLSLFFRPDSAWARVRLHCWTKYLKKTPSMYWYNLSDWVILL